MEDGVRARGDHECDHDHESESKILMEVRRKVKGAHAELAIAVRLLDKLTGHEYRQH